MARLGELCTVQAGGTPSRHNKAYWENGTIPWVKISDIKDKYLDTTEEHITELGLENSSAKIFPAGTILYTIFATLGDVCILNIDATTNQAIVGIQLENNQVDKDYLYHYLLSLKETVNNIGRGVAQNNINMTILRDFEIILPLLDEQRKISAVLDKVSDLIAKRRQQLDKLDELVKSRFIEMFVKNDAVDEWPGHTISDIAKDIRTGPFGSALHHDEFVDNGIFVLGIDNAVENTFSYNRMRYITEEKYQQLKRYTVYPGDVIITIMGTVGRSAVIPNDIPKAINTKHLACITPDIERVDPYFLSFAFQVHPNIRSQLQRQCKGAIMDGLNLTVIKGLAFPIPPISYQHQFIEIYKLINKSKLTIQKSYDKLEILKKSLMQKYFG